LNVCIESRRLGDRLSKAVSEGPDNAAPRADASSACAEVLSDCAWFPHRVDFKAGEVVFTRTNRDALAAEPFLDDRWERSRRASRRLPLTALAEAPELARAPAIIWNSAFCCSTLIADCLDWPGRSLALKEPIALVDFADARRSGVPQADDVALAGLIRLLGRTFTPGARAVIKPSNDANTLIGAWTLFAGPALFLHASQRRFLLAVAKGGETRRSFVRRLMGARATAADARFTARDIALMSDLQVAAVLWRLQMDEFAVAARKLGPERARFLDCDSFLADPGSALGGLDALFDLGLGAARIADIVAGPKLRRHAKAPNEAFDPELESRRFAEARQDLGPELEQLERWSGTLMAAPAASSCS
jgi:hypothetical protein